MTDGYKYQIVEGSLDLAHKKYEIRIAARNGKRVQDVTSVVTEVDWITERIGQPGRLDIKLLKVDNLSFTEGDIITFKVNDKKLFKGCVFEKQKNEKGEISVRCYDQIRYLKAKQSYNFSGMTAGGIVKKISDDFGLKWGMIANTKYAIGDFIWDNGTCIDAITQALQHTAVGTEIIYNFFDDYGHLCLKAAKDMKSKYVLGDQSFVSSYNYTTSIDDDVYNYIKVVQPNESSGTANAYVAKSSSTIKDWGKLQKYEVVQAKANPAQIKDYAKALLDYHNKKKRQLRLKCIGIEDIRAGNVVFFEIKEMGDISLSRYLIVDSVKHTFKANSHVMDLELRVYHELDTKFTVEYEKAVEYTPSSGTGDSGGSGSSGGKDDNLVISGKYYKPIHGVYTITQKYGPSKIKYAGGYFHTGIDLGGVRGTAIYPITSGTVWKITTNDSYGKCVYIKHDDGLYVSLYAHLSAIYVKVGQKVTPNTHIGNLGSSGRSGGPHLHLEVRKSPWGYGNDVDPRKFVSL
jgi:murein DD-endopeptidase MepM/ murein hydrolase activator NlpD